MIRPSRTSPEVAPVPEGVIFEVTAHRGDRFSISCLSGRVEDSTAIGLQELHDAIELAVGRLYTGRAKPAARDVHLLVFDERGLPRDGAP